MTPEILPSHRRSSFAAFILTGRDTLPFGTAYVLPPGTTGRVRQRKSAHLSATGDEGPGQGSANTTGRSGDKDCHDTLRLFWGSDLVESRRKLLAEVKSGGSAGAQRERKPSSPRPLTVVSNTNAFASSCWVDAFPLTSAAPVTAIRSIL